jgi:hypothetical protein
MDKKKLLSGLEAYLSDSLDYGCNLSDDDEDIIIIWVKSRND